MDILEAPFGGKVTVKERHVGELVNLDANMEPGVSWEKVVELGAKALGDLLVCALSGVCGVRVL